MDINNTQAGDIRFYTSSTLRGRFQTDGTFRLNSLTGTGDRIVTADANGVLSATSSATGLVDTLVLSTRDWRQKGDDSLGAIIATKLNISDTASMLDPYALTSDVTAALATKQDILTNPVTGTGTSGQVSYFNGTSSITGENALFWDATNDRLGIGTNSIINADAKFDAVSSTNIRPRIRSTSASAAYLYLQNSSTGTGDGDGLTVGVVGTGAAIINNREATSLTLYTSDVERIFIASGGNVGIGTTNPTGFQSRILNLYGSTGTELHLTSAGSGTSSSDGFTLELRDSDGQAHLNLRENNAIAIATNDIARGYISASGEWILNGSLTDAGDYKLQVSGNAYVTGTTVLAATSGNVAIGKTTAQTNAELDVQGNIFMLDTARIAFRNSTSNLATYTLGYNGTASRYPIRMSLANDSINQRYFEIGRYTGDNIANTWNPQVLMNAWNGSMSLGSGTAPVASAQLEVTSTTKGFLPPRMTTTQRDAISSPAAGLVIYNTTTSKLQVYTTAWTDLH
jgi:hypothetical protein